MGKDPAFLFYYQDFLVGTDHMSREEVGVYIRCLCHQANRGSIRDSHMASLSGSQEVFEVVKEKFISNGNGEFFNERLRKEIEKRKIFTESRLSNLHKHHHTDSHMGNHMENENENINDNKKKGIVKWKHFDFESVWRKYPKKLGKVAAERHFKATVRTEQDFSDIQTALKNYLNSRQAKGDPQFIPHGSTWFNNWRDWVNYVEPGVEQRNEFKVPVYETSPEEQEKVRQLIHETAMGMR